MRIAIIGAGISGLAAAYKLSLAHDIKLFEAGSHIGGHVNTQTVEVQDRQFEIDTGFIVFNDRTYPNFCALLSELQVASQPTTMSFSVRCDRSGCEYNGTSLNGLFAQRRNLFNPSFLRMLRDILRFNADGPTDYHTLHDEETVADYLHRKGFSQPFSQQYLLPMGAAIWSCPVKQFEKFPIQFILEFYMNHGLLSLRDRPQWRVISGGSRQYIEQLIAGFRNRIVTECPITSVRRLENCVEITHANGTEVFDEIVIACHSDQALSLLVDADPAEREVLAEFPYSSSIATLHTDTSVLPRSRRAWASWNYHVPQGDQSRPTLTYNMNMLQGIEFDQTFCVTLNEEQHIDPRKIIKTFRYEHPVFTVSRARVQQRHREFIRRNRTSFCGAYWRNGFHEDGLASALTVCEAFESPNARSRVHSVEAVTC